MEKQQGSGSNLWQTPRRYPRLPLTAHVESLASGRSTTGRTGDIGMGGILVLSSETLGPGTEVRVSFELPGGHRVDAPGEVVHASPCGRMGIRFLMLRDSDWDAIADYIEQIRPYKRRSARLPRHLLVSLRWRDREGNWQEEPAETVLISKHGAMIVTPARLKPGEDATVFWPEAGREAEARIVFREIRGAGQLPELAFEFVSDQGFWGIEFPSDTPLWELQGHSRGGAS